MDNNNTIKEKSSSSLADDFNSPIVEFESQITEQSSQRSVVPKIRIRLRPQVQSSNVSSDELICNDARTNTKDICDKVLLVESNSDNSNWNSNNNKRCYKTLEDSGGGGNSGESHEYRNHFMIHGINLRSRPQKVTAQCKTNTTSTTGNDKKRLTLLTQPQQPPKQSQLKPIAKKAVYQSIILKKSNKAVDEINKEDSISKLSRKQVNKIRNETLISNINLKDIVNQENFIKLPSEIQWQLVNLLPNCDKPKLSSEIDSCKCTDYIYNSNDNYQTYPNLGFSVLNNEFLGKALAKFSLKMGQCDLINILNSERENLRSRPLTILNDESVVKSNVESEIEVNECQNINVSNEDNKMSDELKSNSSTTTTDTVEMNGIGNIDEKSCIEFQNKIKKFENNKLIKSEQEISETIHEDNRQILENLLELPIGTEISIKDETTMNKDVQNLENQILINNIERKHLSPILLHTISVESTDTRSLNSEINDEKRRKRGRKRKLFNSSVDLQITPIKRSNRSTAGKRPARLDSESPPTSPNVLPVTEKKLNIKCKKYKDQMNFNKKHKLKYDNFSEQFDNEIKLDVKSSKSPESILDSSKSLKICPPSPDSLFSGQTESDLSPLSKPSPNGNSLLSNFIRSNVPNHINSVQTLSPSWSCTSESTTPSAKSDYGHIQPSKPSVNVSISVAEIQNSKSIMDAEVKQLQRMPPPRQTLTLAAMREKMRAKKLAKEDNRKVSNSNNRKLSSSSNNQKHKKQNLNILLKEGDDDYKLMEKIISNSEDIDDLFNNSQESLLEFFMGNNYDFDSIGEQCVNLNSFNYKSNFPKKRDLKPSINVMEKNNKIPVTSPCNSDMICDDNNGHSNKIIINECKLQLDKVKNSISENTATNNANKDLPAVEKSFTDAISYVLQKLNLSKETNGVVPHSTPGKSSHPNAYLVDSNGLTTALSIIQSMNPGAKVTTQQFYLVNSGPQLVLQPNPPLTVATEKITNSAPLGFQTKISLAPKVTNPVSSSSQTNNILRDHLPSHNNSFNTVSMGQISYNSMISERSVIQMPETSSLKMSVTEAKNTFMVSSITPNMSCNQSRSLHLQTISTPQPIGFVQPVQQSLPSLFSSQLRFMQPTLSNSGTPNAISFLTSNNATCNASIVNTNQPPKLLFLCPTVSNNSNLVTASNVLNPDQKYLLLSKQPDKQTTIQLVSSQGLWQQLNPNLISQPNNVLVMQSQPINTVYESLICPNTYLPAISPINTEYSINDRKNHLPNDNSQISMSSVFKEQQNKQILASNESNSSSLIIDSRSLNTNPKTESYLEKNIKTGKPTAIDSSMTAVTLSNLVSQSVNSAFSFFPSIQSLTSVASENNCTPDENKSTLLTEKNTNSVHKSDQTDVLQSSQDINSS